MKSKVYETPELLILAMNEDVITTSDIQAGVETTPVPDNGGSWETL